MNSFYLTEFQLSSLSLVHRESSNGSRNLMKNDHGQKRERTTSERSRYDQH